MPDETLEIRPGGRPARTGPSASAVLGQVPGPAIAGDQPTLVLRRARARATRAVGAGKLASGALWSILALVVPTFVNLAMTPLIISHIGTARWGLYLLSTSVSNFIAGADGGIGTTAMRYFAVYVGEGDVRRVTRLLTTTVAMVGGVFAVTGTAAWIAAPYLADAIRLSPALRADGVYLFRSVLVFVLFSILGYIFTALLEAHGHFRYVAATRLAGFAVWVAGLFVVFHEDLGLRGIARLLWVQALVIVMMLVLRGLPFISFRHIGLFGRAETGEFLRYSWKLQVSRLCELVNFEIDTVIVSALFSISTVGHYGSGANFAVQLRAIPLSAGSPMLTALGRANGQEGLAATAAQARTLQRLWGIVLALWMSAAIGVSYFAMMSWLGDDFRLAGEVAVVALVGHTFASATMLMYHYLTVIGRADIEVRISVVGVVMNIAATMALAPFGVLGVAVGTTLGQITASLLMARAIRTKLDGALSHFVRDIPWGAFLLCALVTGAGSYVVHDYAPYGAAGLLCYGLPAVIGIVAFALAVFGRRRAAAVVRKGLRRGSVDVPWTSLLLPEPATGGRHRR